MEYVTRANSSVSLQANRNFHDLPREVPTLSTGASVG